jgi:hypothetical protein
MITQSAHQDTFNDGYVTNSSVKRNIIGVVKSNQDKILSNDTIICINECMHICVCIMQYMYLQYMCVVSINTHIHVAYTQRIFIGYRINDKFMLWKEIGN